jgi:hypothetical protein
MSGCISNLFSWRRRGFMKDEIEVIMWCLGGMIVCVVLAIIFKV